MITPSFRRSARPSTGGHAEHGRAGRAPATVGGTTWQTSVFPDTASASYLLPLKRSVRDAEDLEEGEPVEVLLTMLE